MDQTTATCRTCGETKLIEEFDMRADTGRRKTECKECRRAYQNARNALARAPREPAPARTASSNVLLQCTRCGNLKPASDFPPVRRGEPKLQTWCRACFADANARNYPAYYRRQHDRIAKRAQEHRDEIRRRLIGYLQTHPCVDCGESDIVVLEFDHVGDKSDDVTTYANSGRGWDRIAAEIAKCEVRCANCHRRKTNERRRSADPSAMTAQATREHVTERALQLVLDSALGIRECRVCHVTKPLHEFPFRSLATQTRQWICCACQRSASRKWYEANRDRHATNARRGKRRAKMRGRAFVATYLTSHPCVDCGEDDIGVLDFDHLRDKAGNISAMVQQRCSTDEIRAEIAKCEVRCANCHRRKTCERIGAYRIRMSEHNVSEAA